MNPIAEEILGFIGIHKREDHLEHYGTKRHSGRYPWGSGDNPYQHSGDFLSRVEELKKDGKSEADIANELGLSTTELRAYKSIAKSERQQLIYDRGRSLREDGKTFQEIADELGLPEATLRRVLTDESTRENRTKAMNTADILKKTLEEKKAYLDVGDGVERELGVSKEKLKEALIMLESEGYEVYNIGQRQVTNTGQQTIRRVLCPPGTEYKDAYNNPIEPVNNYISYDGGETFRKGFEYPSSLDSSRLMIRYGDQGGKERDGLVELRRGVKDLDLGNSNYAQVRIMVDGTHYIKGMAVYADDLPPGVDVRFNTNKGSDKSKMEVLKKIKDDPENPFGSLIKDAEHGGQYYYDDPNGKFVDPKTGKKQSLGLINKRGDEGDWGEWADNLPSQFLSKQNIKLINQQLDLAYKDSEDEFKDIMTINNPTVRKHFLEEFASDCDGKAESLKAAALPRQKYQVILPSPDVKDNEVYAPNYEHGETVALIRYPHGGTFEIPIVKVNNKIESVKSMVPMNSADAVVINSKTAQRLSGADFDGDTVMVIPCNSSRSNIKITSKPPLEGLEDFDMDESYPPNPKVKAWPKGGQREQKEMGMISNLITDMTLQGATDQELTRAVKHSMVVIDVAKHEYDYKKSYKENGIAELKEKYQGHTLESGRHSTAANTLISKASGEYSVEKRKGAPKVNVPEKPWYDPSRPLGAEIYAVAKKNTKGSDWYDPSKPEGSTIYVKNHETYVDKKGKTVTRTQKSTWMKETDDARKLSSGTIQEEAYASYANKQKSLANRARVEAIRTKGEKRDPEATKKYAAEVKRLNAEVDTAMRNAPRERQANYIADVNLKAKKQSNPDMTKQEEKKQAQIELNRAREQVGAKRYKITLTDRDWEAIQAGAISEATLQKVMRYADADDLRKRATPRSEKGLSEAKIAKAKQMAAMGYSNAQIGKAIGVSATTANRYINE